MSTQETGTSPISIPSGLWQVDPSAGRLAFGARGLFGLVPVKGSFTVYEGRLTSADGAARGELKISAESVDTGNAKRDHHLRSADFFNVFRTPTITFKLTATDEDAQAGRNANGALVMLDREIPVLASLAVTTIDGSRVRVETRLSIDSISDRLGWSKKNMVRGKVRLTGTVDLVRVDVGSG